jgi:hypothetical protein
MAYFSGPCEIRRAGVDPNGLAQLDLKARDGTFDWHWFLSADERGKEMLAVALAAIVAGKDVDASMDLPDPPADPAWSRVVRFLLID